ncbi:MAG: glycosyltransferase family 4 protein [Solirubrobacteraceae bacterium]|jgi:glycosyltransferase involved in cell wall biosynthesis
MSLDGPLHGTILHREPVSCHGWAFDPTEPLERVEILVDGELVGRARIGLPRGDIYGRFGVPHAAVCGFEAVIPAHVIASIGEPAKLTAVATFASGEQLVSPSVELVVDDAEIHDDGGSRALQLQRRLLATAEPGAAAGGREGPSHLVAFTHRLDLGGGQFYLLDVLRHVASATPTRVTVVSIDDGPLRRTFERLGIDVRIRGTTPVESLELYEGNIAELATWLGAVGADIVIANTLMAYAGVDAGVRLGLPTIWAVHESIPPDEYASPVHLGATVCPYVRDRILESLAGADRVVFEADATRSLFVDFASDASRLVTVPWGVDTAEIAAYGMTTDQRAARAMLGLPSDARVLLCLGTVEPRKSQIMLAQAFERVCGEHPEAFLAVVGDLGLEYGQALRHLLAAGPAADRHVVVPIIENVYDWCAAANVLVSASDLESMPRSAFEAMALGVPYLAADVFGVGELIEHGRTGYLFQPRDAGALARALRAILQTSAAELRTVGAAGQAYVLERHDKRGYLDFYAELLQRFTSQPVR